ncbi:visual pigment-like receptor peropsin [Crassostrea virginica]|uniref:Visual pigment-like receptor peropsin n=1 Tax=Crassostrea virginica TaxID=6565 RepID=A0A8B8CSE9_CRAVI|nr:visual pigment-like receptor peropsin [Crassostrea virginica]
MNGTNVSWAPAGPLVKYYIPQPLYYIIGTGLLFVFIFGSFMNFTGLMVFVKNKNLRSPTNTFIINLLLGDFGISICTFISMTAHYNRFYFWGDNVCTFEGFWMYFMGLTNMFTIMGISFDRYIVISKPLQASKITTRVAVAACLVIWFQGFCWAAFPFLGWGRYTYEAGRTSCSVQWDTNDIESASYNIAIFVWSLFLPLMLIFYAYYHVFMTIRHVARNGVWDMNSRIARKNLRIEKKMFKTIVYMLCSYVGSWTPYSIVSLWAIFGEAKDIPPYLMTVPAVIAKSACIWDPIIYVGTNRQFRMAFYNTLPCDALGKMLIKREEQKDKEADASDDEDEADKKGTAVKKTTLVAPIDDEAGQTTQVENFPDPNSPQPGQSANQ